LEIAMPSKSIFEAAQEILQRLGTDPLQGLTAAQVEKNRLEYGTNQLTPPMKAPLWKQWLDKFKDPTIVILCVCAGIAILVGSDRGQSTVGWYCHSGRGLSGHCGRDVERAQGGQGIRVAQAGQRQYLGQGDSRWSLSKDLEQ
jgi:hypothetical protein